MCSYINRVSEALFYYYIKGVTIKRNFFLNKTTLNFTTLYFFYRTFDFRLELSINNYWSLFKS